MYRAETALRVITGDLDQCFCFHGVTIRLTPLERRLPEVQALVVEQDTGLLLEEMGELYPEMADSASATDILGTQAYDYPLGTVLLKRGNPVRLLMVIHDLECSPNWNEKGIKRALDALFALALRFRLESVAMPTPAHRHGGIAISPSLSLLCGYLLENPPPWEGELWLTLPRHEMGTALNVLQELCPVQPSH